MTILCNGEPLALEDGATVAGLLEQVGVEPDARGIAVAVDGEVVPRGRWSELRLAPDARVEVVTAIQGG
jgi:sulfur carrier protein